MRLLIPKSRGAPVIVAEVESEKFPCSSPKHRWFRSSSLGRYVPPFYSACKWLLLNYLHGRISLEMCLCTARIGCARFAQVASIETPKNPVVTSLCIPCQQTEAFLRPTYLLERLSQCNPIQYSLTIGHIGVKISAPSEGRTIPFSLHNEYTCTMDK